MNILIIGASGFVGCKLANQLVTDGKINGKEITNLILADIVAPTMPEVDENSKSFSIKTMAIDIGKPESIDELLTSMPNVIFHLAGVMSGEAETNFTLGYAVNVDGIRHLLEEIRLDENYKPRLVFASSVAVYGPPLPPDGIVPDDYPLTPKSSYGTQKVISEFLIEDYTRKGYVDGVTLRFPTITVRPGLPNKATSSFVSGIIREPLFNQTAVCPVPLDTNVFVASPRKAVGFLLHAESLSPDQLAQGSRTINMPGLSVTVGEMIDALGRVTGKHAVDLIKHEPDPLVMQIVSSWPKGLEAKRALALGFKADTSYDEIIEAFIDDDLGGWKYHLPEGMSLKPV